ncbi:hypothetical protein ACFYR2_27655 [Streptomyces microflavus]|uniref:hypothetical protein n=1 Tax=Streptomyces microflavus TaxID=1919 RepID=UPI00368A0CAD
MIKHKKKAPSGNGANPSPLTRSGNRPSVRGTYDIPCDFCTGQDAAVAYPCADFSLSIAGDERARALYLGDWSACRACAALVDTDRWGELRHRSLAAHAAAYGSLDRAGGIATAAEFAALWLAFRNHRKPGPPRRLDGGAA